jgi:hypothetical protein
MRYVTAARVEFINFVSVNVEANDLKSGLGKGASKWKTGVTEAKHTDCRAPTLETLACFFKQMHIPSIASRDIHFC